MLEEALDSTLAPGYGTAWELRGWELRGRGLLSNVVPSRREIVAGLGALTLGGSRVARAALKRSVDLSLVLAVDTSLSIDEGEAGLQRLGYVHALRDKRIGETIHKGPVGRIALTYVEWSSPYNQSVVIPWRVVGDVASARSFADELEKARLPSGTTTSISGAIDFSVKLLKNNDYEATRLVVDVSGDGYNNDGRPVTDARDEAVKAGVTINGLPVMNKVKGQESAPLDLDTYYRDNVIGGPGSFYLVARNVEGFSQSVLHKLILEIAGGSPPIPVSSQKSRA